MATKTKATRRRKIHLRIRKSIKGTSARPRLSVFRSNKSIYCQLIDDVNGTTLAAATSTDSGVSKEGNRIDQAKQVGAIMAGKAKDLNINTVVFDRSGYLYHGRVKALADGARENGLKL
ncbi:MAG: 50S ribosomal protein L18 [Bacteroidetes bacterium]|nr:MAG: 50S ribosomal protein L18 [Bacteroidota bacterium]